MKTTKYFDNISSRKDRAFIKIGWIQCVINNPEKSVVQSDGRIKKWLKYPNTATDTLGLFFPRTMKLFITHFSTGAPRHEDELLSRYRYSLHGGRHGTKKNSTKKIAPFDTSHFQRDALKIRGNNQRFTNSKSHTP